MLYVSISSKLKLNLDLANWVRALFTLVKKIPRYGSARCGPGAVWLLVLTKLMELFAFGRGSTWRCWTFGLVVARIRVLIYFSTGDPGSKTWVRQRGPVKSIM